MRKETPRSFEGKGLIAAPADKKLFDDLKAKKEAIEAEIEKKKVQAQKSLLSKKVKKLEKEI